MTWSIVARDAESGAFAVAVTSKFFAVGALCPYAQSGVGALATQALVNPPYGPQGLRLLAEGRPAAQVLELLLAADEGREARQVQLIDRAGRIAAHTGRDCVGWCGSCRGRRFLRRRQHARRPRRGGGDRRRLSQRRGAAFG